MAYTVASAVQVPLSLVALGGALLLLVGAARHRLLDWRNLRKEISWPLFAFVTGMFILIRGVENLGLTVAFGRLLLGVAGGSPLGRILVVAGVSALGANLVNNAPMALVMSSALSNTHAAQHSWRWSTRRFWALISVRIS